MAGSQQSDYESIGLRAVRPYLIVSNADAAIDFYCRVFEASELERHMTPAGGIAHAKLQVGETILEMGEHPDAGNREVQRLPRVGLRLYVTDVDDTYVRALAAGATGCSLRPPTRFAFGECLRSIRPHLVASRKNHVVGWDTLTL